MAQRIRNSTVTDGVGLRKHNTTGAIQNTYQNLSSKKTTTDEDAKLGDNHYFWTRQFSTTGNRINGTTIGSLGKTYVNMQCDDYRLIDQVAYSHLEDSAMPSDALLVAKLLANTNPNRADVDIPTFIGELKDIPSLFKMEATHIKRLAGTNLKYQFGIKPLVRDLIKMLDFQTLTLEREKELQHIYFQKLGIKRNRLLYKSEVTGTRLWNVHDRDKFLIFSNSSITTKRVIRGHVRWIPDGVPPSLSSGDLRQLARKAALGLTVDINTAYQLMPWSWLVDWCSNLGDILANTRNIIPVIHRDLCLIESKVSDAVTSYTDPRVTAGTWQTKEYIRSPKTGNVLDSQMPHLSGRQVSILGSIGVTRRLPRSLG